MTLPEPIARAGLGVFGRLPRRLRRGLVSWWAPSYTVGANCVVVHDGRVLLIRQTYRPGWTTPGGLLDRGELPDRAAVREVREEVGIDITLLGFPIPVVFPGYRRLDLTYRCRLTDPAAADTVRPASPEILDARWFALTDLPELQQGAVEALRVLELAGRLDEDGAGSDAQP